MNPRCSNRRNHAMNLFELLLVISVIVFLLALLLPALAAARSKRSKINCVNNLKQMGLSFRIWSGDNQDKYPMEVSTASGGALEPALKGNVVAIFQVMSNELSTPKILACWEDSQHRFATNFESLTATNLSYFVDLDAGTNDSEHRMLSGDANLALHGRPVKSGLLNLPSTAAVHWVESRDEPHRDHGNLVFADGNVEQLKLTAFTKALLETGLATNRLAIP